MIDAGWETTRLKYVADCNQRVLSESTSSDYVFRYIDIGAVGQGSISVPGALTVFASAPSRARRLAKPGDTLISTVRTYLRAVATVPESDDELVFSTGFAVLHPRGDVSRRFLAYVLQGDEFVDKVVANSVGVSYPAITASDLMALDLLLPPTDEQRAIADYLDRETARIDALVAKQEELIALLRERRHAAICTTIGQLGGMPVRLGLVASSRSGDVPPRDESGGSVEIWGAGRLIGRTFKSNAHADDILVGRVGAGSVGKVNRLTTETWASDNTVILTLDRSRVDARFVEQWLRNIPRHEIVGGGAMPLLTADRLLSQRIPLPDLANQIEAFDRTETTTARIDALIAKAEEHIALAKERRSALITAAVAGQIDVRTARKVS